MKIPTAEEFMVNCEIPTDINSSERLQYIMIEFTKLHVEAALIAAHTEHQYPMEDLDFTTSAYPLTNIK